MYAFFQNIQKHIDTILIGKPNELENLKKEFSSQHQDLPRKCINLVFRYERLIGDGFTYKDELDISKNWNSYEMTNQLNINVCPYCNRNWINTIRIEDIKKDIYVKVTNPQLDHYFSKKDFPLFRLSFYNLIPSCETCNVRIKGKKELKYNINLHPYENGYSNLVEFKSMPKNYLSSIGKSDDFDISLVYTSSNTIIENQIKQNHIFFQIDEIYKYHGDIISELYSKKYHYGTTYLKKIQKLSKNKIKLDELYRIAFGNYITEESYIKRPFAKLTHDIGKQLRLI
jgi:hypothetical protein